jgi:hypothetical protein
MAKNNNDDLDDDLDLQQDENVNGSEYLDLSDDEIMNMSSPKAKAPVVGEAEDKGAVATEGEANEEDDKKELEDAKPVAPVTAEADADNTDPEKEKEPATQDSPLDYKVEYEKLLAPFRANGKEMKVSNVDEAVRLMQLGANYNKKMAAMKPSLKVLKLLDNNGLLDEQRLSFLIDIDKRKPEAITQLLKDSKIDPLSLDIDKAPEYAPSKYSVSDTELEMDSVLDELKESKHFPALIDTVTKKWDGKSKQEVAHSPQLLKVIEGHMASGIYDLISTELDKQRMLGTLNGMSDIEAYKQVGDSLHTKGAFNHLFSKNNVDAQTRKVVADKPAKTVSDAVRQQRGAASSTKSASNSKEVDPDFNPLNLSDEEFTKQLNSKFL